MQHTTRSPYNSTSASSVAWPCLPSPPARPLGEEAIAAIVSGAPVSVLIHSARGAKTFLDLLRKFGLHHWLGSVSVYGISANALTPLEGAGFGALIAAPRPNEDALLALLDETSELARASNAS